jgi:carboxylate-amine ligase
MTDSLSPEALRRPFDSAPTYSVGIEDELMVLDPQTLELAPAAESVLDLLGEDPRYKLELPASQLEIVTPPCETVTEAVSLLLDARRHLEEAVAGRFRFAAAGMHPFSSGRGELNAGGRYDAVAREYGWVAVRELSCALQVHVSIGDADRALSVYNAARSYLPHLTALSANAPFYEGVDTGMASIRPKIAELLPRQGVPPAISSWEEFAEILAWGKQSGTFADAATWWWQLRLHPAYGTVEFRVPDGQSTVEDAGAIASLIRALVMWLGQSYDAGEPLPCERRWRIEENSWSACRHGVEGELVEIEGSRRVATRDVLRALLDELAPLMDEDPAPVERLIDVNGAIAQRRVAAGGDVQVVARWLADRFSSYRSG